jgi:Zn-dependent protease with chaperone function|tara:strand:- start:177 stop:1178 length:1002 start_codon:yes stop_codon:yes gene_type:complete
MECVADCFDGRKSEKQRVRLNFSQKDIVRVITDQGERNYPVQEIVVSPRLGRTARRLEMPDGMVCEVSDNDAVDKFFRLSDTEVPGRLIDKLESKLRYVIIAVVITSLVVWGAISYGIPVLAKHVAFMIPVTASSALGGDALAVLDKTIFSESKLGDTEVKEAKALFSRVTNKADPEYRFRLEFRQGTNIGPNAFALPTGTIIVTDELVQLIEDDHELESILAHEVGHVVYRHSLRQLIQASTISLVIMAVTGDISTVAVMAGSLPTLLTETYYSREFEREADEYSYEYLTNNGISPVHFTNIFNRMSNSEKGVGFLSTHPSVDERLEMFSRE